MLLSLAWIFLLGLALGGLMQKLGLPSLLGMLLTGILLAQLGAIDASLLDISASLREIALVIILLRAGLNLSVQDLKRAGRPAVLLCFLPAVCEIGGILLLAPPLLGCTRLEAAILGSTLAAVSPAVIVPRMLRLMEEGWGKTRAIPQMIMAGASVDDVFVIVLFTAFTGLAQGGGFSPVQLARIPTSILLGVAVGIVWSGTEPAVPANPPAGQRQGSDHAERRLFAGKRRRCLYRAGWLFRPAGGDGHGRLAAG